MAKVQAARFEPSFWDAVYDRYVNSGVEKVHLFAQRDSFGDVVFTKSSLYKSRAVGIDCSFASLIIIKNSLKELRSWGRRAAPSGPGEVFDSSAGVRGAASVPRG